MKFFIAICLIFAALASAAFLEDIIKECAEEFKISLSEAYSDMPLNNVPGQCFVKCVFERNNTFDKNGFIVDRISKLYFSKSKDDINFEVIPMVLKCVQYANQITDVNDCERAYRGAECISKELVKRNLRQDAVSNFHKYRKECIAELKMKDSELEKYTTYSSTEVNTTFPCYLKCVYEKASFFDKDSGLNVTNFYNANKMTSFYTSGELLTNIKNCNKNIKQGINECDRVYEAEDCFFSEYRKYIKLYKY